MKPQTMILSLLLSRLKHMVVTASSCTPLQKLMPWPRQKALVHSEQDVDLERAASLGRLAWESGSGGRVDGSKTMCRRRKDGDCDSGPRGMMVLFFPQVHLQNVGAAGNS